MGGYWSKRSKRLLEMELSSALSYSIQEGPNGTPICMAYSPLPAGLEVERLMCVGDGNLVQWAMFTSANTIYIAFRDC